MMQKMLTVFSQDTYVEQGCFTVVEKWQVLKNEMFYLKPILSAH